MATARTNLGLGSAATNSASAFAPSSGSTNYASATASNTFVGTQAAPDWQVPIGPANVLMTFSGDSRTGGPQGTTTTASSANAQFCGYADLVPARLQEMGFGYSAVVVNLGVAGTTLQDGINNFANDFSTTGNITSGSSTVTITGSTAGIGNNEWVAGPGIPPGAQVSGFSGSTFTLTYYTHPAKPFLTTTGATLVFSYTGVFPSNSYPYTTGETPHQLSPAVNTATYTCTVTSGSNVIALNSGTWAPPIGSLVTSAHFSGTVTVTQATASSITVSANATGSSSTEAVTVVPYEMAFIWYGINDAANSATYTGVTSSTSSATLTGFTGLQTLDVGATVTGANIPAGATVVSNTATTITLSANPTASSSSNTIVVTNTAANWGASYTSLVNAYRTAGYNAVVVMTIPLAFTGTASTTANRALTASYNSYLTSTYGTETSPLVTGVQLIDLAGQGIYSSFDQRFWADAGLHFSPLGNSINADHINALLEARFPSLMAAGRLAEPRAESCAAVGLDELRADAHHRQ